VEPVERRVDVHQHVWTEPLVAALAARRDRPRVRRGHDGGGWVLELDGEPDYPIADDVAERERLVGSDGVDLALVAMSMPVGIEGLPAREAEPLLDAYTEGVRALPDAFGAWGAVGVAEPDAAAVDACLDAGCVGVALPAGALATPARVERLGAVLARLEERDAPLFVHPGPARGDDLQGAPGWWPALTSYVAEMNAAWHAFAAIGNENHSRQGAVGNENHSRLRVVFAMLAGLAPLHHERLGARGGPAERVAQSNLFYDTSSYGPRAIDAMARCVGVDQLVYGSDRPIVEPGPCPLDDAGRHATLVTGPARLLGSAA
jgi:predicted TIM-barrel fold metal-dependent hydrolase